MEIIKLIKEKKLELSGTINFIAKLTRHHEKSLKKFKKKKEEYNKLMDNMEPVVKDYDLEYSPSIKNNSDASPC